MTRGFEASGRQKRTVFLSGDSWLKAKALGDGNASAAIEALIQQAPEPEAPPPDKPPVRRGKPTD